MHLKSSFSQSPQIINHMSRTPFCASQPQRRKRKERHVGSLVGYRWSRLLFISWLCSYALPKLCHNLFFIHCYSVDCDFCKIFALISCVNSNTKMHFLFILKILLCWRYARQVAEFFEFVKKKKEVPSAEAGEGATSSQPQLLMPHHKGGLWVPGGKHFPESALKSLDFRRAMSSFMSG